MCLCEFLSIILTFQLSILQYILSFFLFVSSKLLYCNVVINDLGFLHTPFRLRSARLLFYIRIIRFFRSFEAPFERLLLENIIPLDSNSIEVIMREVNLIISKLLEETIPYTFP